MDSMDNPQKTDKENFFVMKTPFFSIITPIFRAKDYISRCIESCLTQSFQDFELILIDDCGQDGTIRIAQAYAEIEKNITILHNPHNLGAFHSRARGIEYARGEYCLFVDCDDFIAPNTLETLYQLIEKNPADIIHFCFSYFPSNLLKPSPPLKNSTLTNPTIYQTLNTNTTFQSICDKAIKSKYAKLVSQKLDFIHSPFSCMEDGLFFLIATFEVQSYISIDKKLYFYQNNPQSTTKLSSQITFDKKLQDFKNGLKTLQHIKTLYPQHIAIIQQYETKIISAYILEGRKYGEKEFQQLLAFLSNHHFIKKPLSFLSTYLKSTSLSIRYFYRWQTLARICFYLFTLGKIKL